MTPVLRWLPRGWARAFRPPRRLRTTGAGRTYLVLTVGVGLGALNTGNNLLYLVLGLQLATIVVSGILSEWCLRRVQVRRVLPEAPRARTTFHLGWALSRTAGHGFALSVWELHPLLGEGIGQLAWLPPGEERVIRAPVVVPRRGPLTLGAVRVATNFPFGLFVKSRDIDLPGELLILPGRVPALPESPRSATGTGEVHSPRRGLDGEGDLAQLRELREGEDARRIHWRKSAQLGTLLRIERDAHPHARIVLHLDDGAPAEALDGPCEALAARAEVLLARGAEVGLETTGGISLRPSTGVLQARAILRALARAGHGVAR
jgi:uncharacterized protein (DUF58 family)